MSHPQPSLTQRQFTQQIQQQLQHQKPQQQQQQQQQPLQQQQQQPKSQQVASPSPTNTAPTAGFSLPPSKRPNVSSPAPQQSYSQPNSPYPISTPYAQSPSSGTSTPTTGLPSPALPVNLTTPATSQIPQSPFNSSNPVNGRFGSIGQTQATQAAHAAQNAQHTQHAQQIAHNIQNTQNAQKAHNVQTSQQAVRSAPPVQNPQQMSQNTQNQNQSIQRVQQMAQNVHNSQQAARTAHNVQNNVQTTQNIQNTQNNANAYNLQMAQNSQSSQNIQNPYSPQIAHQAAQNGQARSPVPPPSQTPVQPAPSFARPPSQASTPTITHTPPVTHTYSNATLAPMNTAAHVSTSASSPVGIMGPPALHSNNQAIQAPTPPRPAASKTTSYEVNDMLMGTGIDLEAEAEYMNSLDTRTGFPHLPAGGKDSFYGAGLANQPGEPTDAKTQEELAALAADRAWNEAAHRLAITRSQELRNHFLEPGIIHKRMHDVANKFGLTLNLDVRPDTRTQYMGRLAAPAEFPKPELKVSMKPGPEGTDSFVQTFGSFIPKEAFLVDQVALLSISTKEYLRDLLSEANKIAVTRQRSSHGTVPTEWLDAAVSPIVNGKVPEGTRTGTESAVSPRTNPLKRPSDEISNNGLPTPVSEASPPNYLIESLLEVGKQTQSQEEGRLRKRQKRLEKLAEKDKEGGEAGSRSGSVAPGTPGSIAPEDTKTLSKKEGKKAAAKAAESSSGTTVNATLSLFTGGKKKKYSWMNSGAGSGASTPRAQGSSFGAGGGSGGTSAGKAARGPLTKSSVTHLGQFREDSEKGKNIQLRDWIVVLEERGTDPMSLQTAYTKIDMSHTGDRVATENA